jgi:hypothetical protein
MSSGIRPFLPEIIVHGSLTAADYFTFENTWSPVSIYSHGGDDAFMFGAANKHADGTLDGVDGEVSVFAGSGTDRMYLNDQGFWLGTAGFIITDRLIQDASRPAMIQGTGQPTIEGIRDYKRFADIHFDESLEVARINGSITVPNKFEVVPSIHTRFVFQGSENSNDRLFVNALYENREIFRSNNDGAWSAGDQARNIHFLGIESVSDLRLVQSEANDSFPVITGTDASILEDSNGGFDNLDSINGFQTTDNAFETI